MAAPGYLNRFPFKKFPVTTIPVPLLIHGTVALFFLYIIFDCARRLFNFLSFVNYQGEKVKTSQKLTSFSEKLVDGSLSREEVETIMANLGIFANPESAKIQERLDSNDIFDLFGDELEAKEQDVKEAFDVFDENKDGFIDERDLQRVLSAMGLKEVAELDNCKKMIMAFDENGDGRIDFQEFVKLF
ncbi:putative calcium-binding protein CML30 [Capsicum annuum]|uniref:Calcium-binding protein CML30 n=1 Tax=Capsicum annuum TaxID=4072 RepID=A0A1U8FY78_CAPAN|nr:probable calcium-binding protein CML45 [Capsicum annuum]KAF3616285.1 putative calcium-binding protein CML30 [Capsicum annuum]KAF3619782.1 putative calcium-binding protein CML30 [Capsicum annuum]PHT91886.1 putative calcium-binding protein CML30 [Capsicum annuum]